MVVEVGLPGVASATTRPVIDDPFGFGSGWQVDAHNVWRRREVACPAAVGHGVTLPHQEAVAEVRGGTGIVRCCPVVEPLEYALAATIAEVVEDLVVAAAKIHRPQDIERGSVKHLAVGARRQPYVRDDRVVRVAGDQLALERSRNF